MKPFILCVVFASLATVASAGDRVRSPESHADRTASGDLTTPYVEARHVSARSPMSLASLLADARAAQTRVLVIESRTSAGAEDITDFLVLAPNEKAESAASRMAQYRRDALADTLASARQLPDAQRTELLIRLNESASIMRRTGNADEQDMTITGATLVGEPHVVDMFIRDHENLLDKDVTALPSSFDAPVPQASIGNAVTTATTPAKTWYPNEGYSITGATGTGTSERRYTQQFMTWFNPSFTSTQTYEHDFFVYNYDRKSYFNTSSTPYPDCYPVTDGYAQTTYPTDSKPYLDTRFSWSKCEIDEVPFTIGVAQASMLVAKKSYWTYFKTSKGNVTSSKFKLQAQRGYRSPTFCYSTWCSNGDQILTLVPAWKEMPGLYSWVKQ
jgi:hypothetical protein